MDLDHDDLEDEDGLGWFYDCMIWDYLPEWCLDVAASILYYALSCRCYRIRLLACLCAEPTLAIGDAYCCVHAPVVYVLQ